MKASIEQQSMLLEVQSLDIQLRQLAHRRRTLPELADLATLETTGASLRDSLVAAETEVSDLTRAQAKADADVEQVRGRAERDRARLEGGGAAKDLMGLQHELETLGRRQADLEEVDLEIMERLEAAQARLTAAQADQAIHMETVAGVTVSRDGRVAELEGQARQIRSERDSRLPALDGQLLELYRSVAAHSGIGAATLEDNRCGGCRLEISPVDLAAIRRAAPEDIVQCEECSCILVRTKD